MTATTPNPFRRFFPILLCLFCAETLLPVQPQKGEFTTKNAETQRDPGQEAAGDSKPGVHSSDPQQILSRARTALKKGNQKEALRILSELGESDGAGHFAAGRMLVEEKAYGAAAGEFGLARRTYKDPYTAGYDQALAYLNAGDYPSAIETANELLNQGHQTAELADVAATAYLKTSQTKEAYNALRLATHLDPKNEDAYVGLCQISLDYDNYDLGLELANIGLSHLPNSERLYVQRGVMRAMKAQFSEAEQDFATAAKLAPQEVLPAVALALVLMQNSELDKAVEVLRQTASQHPNDYFAQYWLAVALLHAGAVPGTKAGDEVLAALQASVRSNPEFWHSRTELGKALLDRGDVDPAIVQLQKAAGLNPAATSPLFLLAQAYRRKGDETRARELAAQVSKMQTDDREALPQASLRHIVREETSSPSAETGEPGKH